MTAKPLQLTCKKGKRMSGISWLLQSLHQGETYRGLKPTIPPLMSPDPREFARMKITLENLISKTSHLKCEGALLMADSLSTCRKPYTNAMRMLTEMYGQPLKLAKPHITELMNGPCIKNGDLFALCIRSMVGMLEQQGDLGYKELDCFYHATRLLSKLPYDLQISFDRFIELWNVTLPTLTDLAEWLDHGLKVQRDQEVVL